MRINDFHNILELIKQDMQDRKDKRAWYAPKFELGKYHK